VEVITAAGLVGCGDVAARYAAAMTGIGRCGIRLSCVTDASDSQGRAFAERQDLTFVPTMSDLLAQPVELICICTPNATHFPLAERCLQAGRHVLVEHPLATRLDDAERLHNVALACGRSVFVVRQRRYHSTIQMVRRALAERLLGEVVAVDAVMCWNRRTTYFTEKPWRSEPGSGGVVLNQASHFLDILLHLFGEYLAVESCLGNLRHAISCEDSACGVIHFPGIRARFRFTVAAPEGCNRTRLFIKGTKNSVLLSGVGWEMFEGAVPNEMRRLAGGVEHPSGGDHGDYFERVHRRLNGERIQVVDSAEGLRTTALIENIYAESLHDNSMTAEQFTDLFSGNEK